MNRCHPAQTTGTGIPLAAKSGSPGILPMDVRARDRRRLAIDQPMELQMIGPQQLCNGLTVEIAQVQYPDFAFESIDVVYDFKRLRLPDRKFIF